MEPMVGHRRVLVVDDDPGVRRLLRRVLALQGLRVHEAPEGEQGLRAALGTPYDVILLDLELPRMDGLTVLRRLLAARPDQTVIICSCRSDAATRAECLRAGARAVLPKPFSVSGLWAALAATQAESSPVPAARGAPIRARSDSSRRGPRSR